MRRIALLSCSFAVLVVRGFIVHPKLRFAQKPQIKRKAVSENSKEKAELLSAIESFKAVTARDGVVPIDFGVKGGELENKDRTPKNLAKSGAFYQVSEDVGKKADEVLSAVSALQKIDSLASDATKYFGTEEGAACPLHGTWQNIFTTAADATFSPDSKRGDASVGNVINARRGTITNVISFKDSNRKIDQLRVSLSAYPVSPTRLRLTFLAATLQFHKRFLFLFKKIVIPVPAATFTKIIFFFQRIPNFFLSLLPFLRKRITKKEFPKPPFFDVLYLDKDLRVQQTGDGNIFIQKRLPPALAGAS